MQWRSQLTDDEKQRIETALKAKGFTDIQWSHRDTVSCRHKSHDGRARRPKGIVDLVRNLGFYVPCGGIGTWGTSTRSAYCQVWVEEKG